MLALVFGLVHGLGFAGGLSKLGLAREELLPALFFLCGRGARATAGGAKCGPAVVVAGEKVRERGTLGRAYELCFTSAMWGLVDGAESAGLVPC